jgi:hypothetical protein
MKNAALGYGYIRETTDTSLGIHLHACVATFNPTCLSRCLPTEGLLFLNLLNVCDMNSIMYASYDVWDEFLLMDSKLHLKLVL